MIGSDPATANSHYIPGFDETFVPNPVFEIGRLIPSLKVASVPGSVRNPSSSSFVLHCNVAQRGARGSLEVDHSNMTPCCYPYNYYHFPVPSCLKKFSFYLMDQVYYLSITMVILLEMLM